MILTASIKLKLLSNRRQALNRNYDGADCNFHDCYVAQTYTYDFYDDDVCRNEQLSSFPWALWEAWTGPEKAATQRIVIKACVFMELFPAVI